MGVTRTVATAWGSFATPTSQCSVSMPHCCSIAINCIAKAPGTVPARPLHAENPLSCSGPATMDLDDIAGVGGQQEQREQYKAALDAAVASGDVAACKRFVDHGAEALVHCGTVCRCDHGRRHPRRTYAGDAAAAAACPRCRAASLHASLPVPAVLSDAVPLVLSRTLLMAFAQSLQQLTADVQQSVAT